jgi:phosphatidylglycerol:prolipoprotein diacylglycerol transferase
MADICAPALIIGHAIGRLGCQFSGDGDWGLPSTLPWAMAYPKAIVGWNAQTVLKLDSHDNLVSGFFPGVRVHPTPVYESILYAAVFLFLWSIRKKPSIEQNTGRLFYLYLMLAGASRFLVEFVRINPRIFLGLSEAQLISIAMMLIGIIAYRFAGAKLPILSAQRPVRA